MRIWYWILLLTGLFSLRLQAQPLLLVSGEWPPYVSADLPGQGASSVLVRKVLAEAGFELQIKLESWPRAEAMVRQGEVFAAFPYLKTPERDKAFDFSTAFLPAGASYLFYYRPLRPNLPELHSIADLAGLRVTSAKGYWYEPAFARARIPLLFANDEAQQLRLLKHGRGDVALLNYYQGWYLIQRQYGKESASFASYPYPLEHAAELSLLVSRHYPESAQLLQRINAAIARLTGNGSLDGLKRASMQTINLPPPPVPARVLIP